MPKKNTPFGHDVEFRKMPETMMLRNKYGNTGYVVYLMLKEVIAEAIDYQVPFTEDMTMKYVVDFGVDHGTLTAVVKDLLQLQKLQIRKVEDTDYLYCPDINEEMAPLIKTREKAKERMRKLRAPKEKIKQSKRVKKKDTQPKLIDVPEKTHPLQDYVKQKYPRVSKMTEPLTLKQAEAIQEAYPDGAFVRRILRAMNNYKPLTAKYCSVKDTFDDWAEKDWERWRKLGDKAGDVQAPVKEERNYDNKL